MQTRQPLDDEDTARLEAQRNWVRGHFEPQSQHLYSTLDEKLRLLDTMLAERWIERHETVKLQCLGVSLGDALVQGAGLSWVMVEDEYGRDPALELRGTSILLFPLTMISKRVEKGEDVDVRSMYSGLCEKIRELASMGG